MNKVVISEEVATKFFGDNPALGKLLQIGDERNALEITGVTRHQPENAHFRFDYLQSIYTNPNIKRFEWSWLWTQTVTYVKLRPNANPIALEEKMRVIGEKTIKPTFAKFGIDYDDFLKGKDGWNFYLRPMMDIHLRSNDNRIGTVGDIKYAYTFAIVGFFVLLIAAINFINLSTARATQRSKEVGVKKALGAVRSSLISQFQSESIIVTVFSTLLALLITEGLRLAVSAFVQINIPFTLWQDRELLIALPFVPLVIGFLAGLYPSFYLTSFRPAHVLKGRLATGMGNSGLRNSLVVVQFTISIALMVGMLVVYKQLNFMQNANLGYNKENVIAIRGAERLGNQLESFRDEVAGYGGVVNAAIAMDIPAGTAYEDVFSREGTDMKIPITLLKIDNHFFDAMGFNLLTGRQFDERRPSDTSAIIPNETAVRLLGWTPEKALGERVLFPGNDGSTHEIIGVVKDFHFQSLRTPIAPLLFSHVKSNMWGNMRTVIIRFNTNDVQELVMAIEKRWGQILDDTPIELIFLDDELGRQYQEEQRLGGLFGIFAAMSVAIAIIGLVGLVAYSAEVRKKEIGIRKVFGASTPRILVMMNSQYFKLIAIGLVIAIPLSWWMMDRWLQDFEYKTTISPMVFATAGLAELVIALGSVAYLSLKAASTNPASVLKEE